MDNTPEKTIKYNEDFWNVGKKSRKNTKKKTKPSDEINVEDTNFSNQLAQLTQIMNTNNENPNWGNLKNGILPTYRTYMNNNNFSPQQNNINNNIPEQIPPPLQPSLTKQPHESKYFLGKDKRNRTTRVRIQGKKSRRKVKKYIRDLEQQPITDIKNELYNNCLIKCGGNTPIDVLKEMYKATKLSGGIKNKNGEILLHNFNANEESNAF